MSDTKGIYGVHVSVFDLMLADMLQLRSSWKALRGSKEDFSGGLRVGEWGSEL